MKRLSLSPMTTSFRLDVQMGNYGMEQFNSSNEKYFVLNSPELYCDS